MAYTGLVDHIKCCQPSPTALLEFNLLFTDFADKLMCCQ